MSFLIRFTTPQVPDSESGLGYRLGLIRLGDYDEVFQATLGYWSDVDYEKHWLASIRQLVHQKRSACFVTDILDPDKFGVHVRLWAAYPSENIVYFQEQIRIDGMAGIEFNYSNPNQSVAPRRTHTTNGDSISEWKVNVSRLAIFLDQIQKEV